MSTKRTSLDEKGITLEAVIITAIAALMAAGAGVIVYNVISSESDDIDSRAQTAKNVPSVFEVVDGNLVPVTAGPSSGGPPACSPGQIRPSGGDCTAIFVHIAGTTMAVMAPSNVVPGSDECTANQVFVSGACQTILYEDPANSGSFLQAADGTAAPTMHDCRGTQLAITAICMPLMMCEDNSMADPHKSQTCHTCPGATQTSSSNVPCDMEDCRGTPVPIGDCMPLITCADTNMADPNQNEMCTPCDVGPPANVGPGQTCPATQDCRGQMLLVTANCPPTYKAISGSNSHACLISDFALDANGLYDSTGTDVPDQVYCFGQNGNAQFGSAMFPDPASPDPDATSLDLVKSDVNGVTQVVAGDDHTCALKPGMLLCWGRNSKGQLGIPSAMSETAVAQIMALPGVTQVSADSELTCVLQNGQVRCRGTSRSGKNGGTSDSHIFNTILESGGTTALANVQAIVAGFAHACALKDGDVYCWGSNGDKQLSPSSATSSSTSAIKISGIVDTQLNVRKATIGDGFTCILADRTTGQSVTGGVWCWGENKYGQTGATPQGGNIGTSATPILPTTPNRVELDGTPIAGVLDIDTSGELACALLSDKRVVCWGENGTSNTRRFWTNAKTSIPSNVYSGSGRNINRQALKPTVIPMVTDVEKLVVLESSACIINGDQEIKCFGFDDTFGSSNEIKPFVDAAIQAALGNP